MKFRIIFPFFLLDKHHKKKIFSSFVSINGPNFCHSSLRVLYIDLIHTTTEEKVFNDTFQELSLREGVFNTEILYLNRYSSVHFRGHSWH